MAGLPLLVARGESIPEAWENSVLELRKKGLWYKRDDPEDNGLQVDSTMAIEISNPDSDLFMHKYMTCGIEDLLDYEMEIHGAKDSWRKNLKDSKDKRWDYLYHERLASYPGSEGPLDQIQFMIDMLCERFFSRRINSITWVPERDMKTKDTPCLQGIRFLITPDKDSPDIKRLNMRYNFRSRNVMIASPMNMIGMYSLQCTVRDAVKEKSGMNLQNGSIVDFVDSYHISTRDQETLRRFIERYNHSAYKGETIADRAYDRAFVFNYMNSILPERTEVIINQTRNYLSGDELTKEIKRIKKIAESRKR